MPKKNPIAYNKRPDPPFIAQFKERIKHKETSSLANKLQSEQSSIDQDQDTHREDESPQIVQLREGDISEQVYKEVKEKEDLLNSAASSGKIVFKKPQKRVGTATDEIEQSTLASTKDLKKKKIDEINKKLEASSTTKLETKAISNKKLLSFEDEEEEDQ